MCELCVLESTFFLFWVLNLMAMALALGGLHVRLMIFKPKEFK